MTSVTPTFTSNMVLKHIIELSAIHSDLGIESELGV